MRPPLLKTFEGMQKNEGVTFCRGTLHPAPRLYKHHWQIFSPDSEYEGLEFFEKAPRISTARCMERLHELATAGTPCLVYTWKQPRKFTGMPFDPEKWKGATWAPSWDDDDDPIWEGHK